MTILQSTDGKFFDLPENELKKYEVPAEKVKDILASLEGEESDGDVRPYGYGYGWYPPVYFYPRRRRRHYYYDYGY